MTKPELLVSGLGVGTALLNSLVRRAKQCGLKPEHIHLLVTNDERADFLVKQMAGRMVEVLEEALLQDEECLFWEKFYRDVFNMTVDLSNVVVPSIVSLARKEVIYVPKGVTYNNILSCCKTRFKNLVYSYYDNLDDEISLEQEQRHPANGSYAVRHGGHVEATDGDHELRGLSWEALHQCQVKIMTGLERMLWELFYEYTHRGGQHLDKRDTTLTSSRYRDGGVLDVYWHVEFCVDWCTPQHSNPCLRARVVDSVV